MSDDDKERPDLSTFNLVAASVMTLFGVFALAFLIPDHVPASAADDQGLGARFMPTLAVGALTLLTCMLGLNVFIRRVRGLGPIREDNEDNDDQGFHGKEALNTLAMLLGSALYVALLSTMGFVVSSAIGLAACLLLGGVRNWLLIAVLSLGIPLALSQILWWGLTIQLPPFQLFD